MASDQQKPPSAQSFDLFRTRVASDETLPASLRKAIADNLGSHTTELLAAIKKAIGGDGET
jgi:hypothetical protein